MSEEKIRTMQDEEKSGEETGKEQGRGVAAKGCGQEGEMMRTRRREQQEAFSQGTIRRAIAQQRMGT